jgi:aldose sugar dehydrogenase
MQQTARIFFIALSMILLSAVAGSCGSDRNTAPASQVGGEPQLARTVVLPALDDPWDLAFTPDGAMLFTEKCRGLSVRQPQGKVHRLFGTAGSAVVADDLFCQGQSGMNGVTVDPEFADNRFIYVYMASNRGDSKTNRVVRLTVDAQYTTVSDRQDIVTDISYKKSLNSWGGAGTHSGGRIHFSPVDGFLYVATGDNHDGPLPQDLTRLGGKILRIDRNGKAAPGNKTPAGGDPRIYTYGHRNVQGLAFHPATGQPFACEHGPRHNDEVTPLVAGGNGGWSPEPEEGVRCASNYCGYTSNKRDGSPTPMTDLDRFPDALRPSWTNKGASEGMGPCVFLDGGQWQAWNGRLAVGFLRGKRIELLQIDKTGMTHNTVTITGIPKERIRSLVQGPDGALYVAIDAGEIWRLTASPQR